MSLWLSGVIGVPVAAFRKQFATQSRRSGVASAAVNFDIPKELFGHHGDWKSWKAQKRYMKSSPTHLLSVSRATMSLPRGPAPDGWIEYDSAINPPPLAEDYSPPDVVGVPEGAFV
jgi:hypothetical protein